MLQDFIVPFIAIGVAELGDKTQLAIFCLASKTKKRLQLLAGIALAFLIADGLAVLLGDFFGAVVPLSHIKIASGIVFIIFGALMLARKQESNAECELKKPLMSGFALVLLSEMGDKTQVAAGLFAAKFNPVMVFFGVIASLLLVSLAAVFLGKWAVARINRKALSFAAGILFIAIGIFCFF
jgi:putative Ca2+/H+ antiporter (TMEM165/GDT1 family)